MIDLARRPTTRRFSRSATVLICVLACLLVTAALVGTTTQTVLRERQAVRRQQQLRQTELLCEAGVRRAVRQLQRSTSYSGERWSPRLKDLPWDDSEIEIRVTQPNDNASDRSVEVIAKLGSEQQNIDAMQRTHTFTIEASASSSSEK